MPKPKFVKPLLISTACAIPVGLVVGLSVNWQHTQFISAVGSSGVKPFIESFGKEYHNQFNNIDVTVEAGGTAFAVEQLSQGFTNIGNASNNPYYTVEKYGYSNQWKDKKTFTLGWEGLVLMYSLPKNLSQEAKDKFEIVINSEKILKLYGVFSCIHELSEGGRSAWQPEYDNLWFYRDPDCTQYISEDDRKILENTPILPFLRTGGNTGANSSIAFTYYSNLTNFEDMSDNQQKAFNGGQYGSDGPHVETDESNARAWQSFVAKDQPGSMVYLTTSFLTDANIQLMKENGYKLAKYGPAKTSILDNDGKLNLDAMDIKVTGYNWFRPINIMIDLNQQKTVDFVKWIYNNPEIYKSIVNKKGAKELSQSEIKTMQDTTGDMFSSDASDIELAADRDPDLQLNEIYGAIQDIWNV